MHITTPLADELGRYLDLATQRMQLIAGNMANVDTPGYRTQDIDFQKEFSRVAGEVAAERGPQGTGAGALHTPPQIEAVDGLLERPDGNNVSIDRESMALGELQLQFRTGSALLKREFTRMSEAIHEDGK
jgi:flagellar basal-body rod protein FlgB